MSPKLWPHYRDYPFRAEFINSVPASGCSPPRSGQAERGHVDTSVADVAREADNIEGCGQPGGNLALVRAWACGQVRRTALMGDSASDQVGQLDAVVARGIDARCGDQARCS